MKAVYDDYDRVAKLVWTPHALPSTRNLDHRPLWEPPILEYSTLIGEEYEKKRDAVLKHFLGDASKTTSFLDADIETNLLDLYDDWISVIANAAESTEDLEREAFYDGLLREVQIDALDALGEWRAFGIELDKRDDGNYEAVEDVAKCESEDFADDERSGAQRNARTRPLVIGIRIIGG